MKHQSPQPDLPGAEAFNLASQTSIDGERVQREAERLKAALAESAKRQVELEMMQPTCPEPEEPKNTAVFDGQTLTTVCHYDWPRKHTEALRYFIVEPAAATYWAAVNGKCFAFKVDKGSCIAGLQGSLAIAFDVRYHSVYVIWKPQNTSPGNWNTWSKKWSGRTAGQKHSRI